MQARLTHGETTEHAIKFRFRQLSLKHGKEMDSEIASL